MSELIKVDVDVVQLRIQRGLSDRFDAELVREMARSLITGQPVKLVYNDQVYTVKGAV
jgi:hypothetical protein